MTIAIDFDDTLVNTSEVASNLYKKIYGKDEFMSLNAIQKDDFVIENALEISKNIKLFAGVKDALKFFKENGIKLLLITARHPKDGSLVSDARKFIKENNLYFDDMIFGYFPKGAIAKENNVDLMIDDNDFILSEMLNHDIKVLKYGTKSLEYDFALNWQEVKDFVIKEEKCE